MNKTRKWFKDYKFYLLLIYVFAAIVFVVQTFISKLIPLKYITVVAVILILLGLAFWFLLFSKRINKFNRAFGVFLTVVLAISMIVGNVYLYSTYSALGSIASEDDKEIGISIVVLKDSKYKTIEDLDGKPFGRATNLPDTNVDKVQEELTQTYSDTLEMKNYESVNDFADALYNKEVEAILLNEGSRGLFDEKHPKFNEETRVIKTFTYTEEAVNIAKPVDVTKDPFVMYVSGIDTYGSVQTVSRTDVNMLLAVNPNTHQILIVSIPRDYYVAQTCQSDALDKLTHTGIFGIDCSVSTLENFFGMDINYYGRVNFSSLVDIVDALGGITVNSPVAFSGGEYTFVAGENHINGNEALAFVRERYSLSGGDNDRVKNQARVISGIIDKATSPSILTGYVGLMNSLSNSFQLNMTSDELSSLVQMQLNDMKGWKINQVSVSGSGETNWSPANGFNAYVMRPNMDTVEYAKALMQKVLNGEIIDESQL